MATEEGQELAFDFTDAIEFTALPAGWYDVEVIEARPGTSAAGNPKVTLRMKVLATGEDYDGRTLIDDLVTTGKGSGRAKQALMAFYGTAPETQMRVSTSDLVGCRANVRVTQRVWAEEDGGDGEMRNNVTRYRPVQGDTEELAAMFEEQTAAEPEGKAGGGLFGRK